MPQGRSRVLQLRPSIAKIKIINKLKKNKKPCLYQGIEIILTLQGYLRIK